MENLKQEEREHARLGGSSAHRWMNCFGSVSLIESLPVEDISYAARLGTYAHEIAEKKLKVFLEHKISGMNFPPIKVENKDFEDFEIERVDIGTDLYVKAVWEKVLEQSLTGKAFGFEEKFTVSEDFSAFGYADFWVIYISDKVKRVGVIGDFKNGYKSVDIKKNAQLAFYAVALRNFARSNNKDLDEVRCFIFQPNKAHGEAYTEMRLTAKQLDVWEKKFTAAAHKILIDKNTRLKAGSWCEFCRAQAVCKAYVKETEKNMDLKLLDVKEITLPAPETLSDEVLARIVTYKDMLEDFLKAVTSYALARCQGSTPIKGLKIISGPTKRCWRDNEEEIADALTALGVTNPWNRKLMGITSVEKLIGKGRLQDFCTTTTAREIVVPDTDPRPKIRATIELLET